MAASEGLSNVTYEQLAELEHEFDELDVEIIRKQYVQGVSLFAKRRELVSQIPNFWPLVFEAAPPEIDSYIQPSDSEVFAKCLTNLEVSRFEVPLGPEKIGEKDDMGDPRSLLIRFEFAENEWFEDTVLEKKLWFRRAEDGWTGLVSEPVKIHWKKGKDMTNGLMDGALNLWEARQKAGDMSKRDLAEFDALARIVENWSGANTSFFTWFAFISNRRWVSAEESAKAVRTERDRRQQVREGKGEAKPAEMPSEDPMEQQVEVHEDGEGIANVLAEDLWPGAIRYFINAQEAGDLSEGDFEDDEDDEDGDMQQEDDDEDPDAPIDIRSLVQSNGRRSRQDEQGGNQRPSKKQKQRR
ncbi:hypothetical protein MBLNU457_g1066t1 [Dothideomycetes sp. NU457]